MRTRDVIRLGSCRVIDALLNETETSALPGVVRTRAAFKTEIGRAEALEKRQSESVEPALELRNAAFEHLETVVLDVGGRASSYAVATGDPQLILRCHLPRGLTRGAFDRRLTAAEKVHDQLVELLPVLEESEVTSADLAELAEAIATARSRLVEPRQQLGRRMDATAELAKQVRRLGEFVRLRLDPLFRPLRRTNPGLYLRYRVARRPLYRAARRKPEADGAVTVKAPAAPATVTAATATTASGGVAPSGAGAGAGTALSLAA